jgi:thymidylate synthase
LGVIHVEIEHDSLDGVLMKLYQALLESPGRNQGTQGDNVEILGVALRLRRPRARLSRSEDRGHPFSALGELLWYLSGRNDLEFIEQYIGHYRKFAQDGRLYGAYGPRLFGAQGGINQIENVTDLLRRRSWSRRAVIQLFDARDLTQDFPEIPCTTTLQFHLRSGVLHLSTCMRSNDAYWGLPHDVFCFTMLQEMIARRLGAELGEYFHYVGSMHVYDPFMEGVQRYVDEGHQRTVEMPSMPPGDPFSLVGALMSAEAKIRNHEPIQASDVFSDPYWTDIIRLLQVFWASGEPERLDQLKADLHSPIYREYLEGRRARTKRGILGFLSRSKEES